MKWRKTVTVVSHAREFLNMVQYYSPSLIFPVEDKSIIVKKKNGYSIFEFANFSFFR